MDEPNGSKSVFAVISALVLNNPSRITREGVNSIKM